MDIKKVMGKACTNCNKPAVMDLVFGEMVAVCSIPWCEHCVAPDTWNGDPYHHAEAYSYGESKECKTDKCFITGCTEKPVVVSYYESKNGEWKDSRPYCRNHYKGDHPHTVYAPNSQMIYRNSEWLDQKHPYQVEKEKVLSPLCPMCHSMKGTCEHNEDNTFGFNEPELPKGVCADAIQGNLYVKDNPSLRLTVAGDAPERPPVPDYVPLVDIEDTKALYSRQPHYEGGIDPITYGQDNFTPQEMNGFYKMNVVKYVSRCDRKNGLEDLKKAQDYLNLLIKSYEKRGIEQHDDRPQAVGKKSGRKSPLIKEHWATEEDTTHAKYKQHAQDLHAKGETFISREEGQQILDSVENYACGTFKQVDYSESLDGWSITVMLNDEREKVIKEAELCVSHLRQGRDVQIKRADVAKEVLQRIQGQSYYMSYDDGVTRIKLKEES